MEVSLLHSAFENHSNKGLTRGVLAELSALSQELSSSLKSQGDYFMQVDGQLMGQQTQDLLMHRYDWNQLELTLGLFNDENLWIKPQMRKSWARRPTGGGVMIHGRDFCFSIAASCQHEIYSWTNQELYLYMHKKIAKAIESCLGKKITLFDQKPKSVSQARAQLCFSDWGSYEGLIDGKKVFGSALRRSRLGLVHQFSVNIMKVPTSFFESIFFEPEKMQERYQNRSTYLLDGFSKDSFQTDLLQKWRNKLEMAILKQLSRGISN